MTNACLPVCLFSYYRILASEHDEVLRNQAIILVEIESSLPRHVLSLIYE